jgi:RHS repeat-associated protein
MKTIILLLQIIKKPIIVTKNEDSITLEYTDGIIETYQEGYLVEKKDKNNNKITLHYDENYLLQKVSSGSSYLNFIYNSNGFVSQVQDHSNRIWNYNYDDNGNLKEVINPLEEKKAYNYQYYKHQYDAFVAYLITDVKDDDENSLIDVAYDTLGRVDNYIKENQTYTYTYHSDTKVSKKDQANNTITYELDDGGLITKITNKLGLVKELNKYDEANSAISHTIQDENGNYKAFIKDNLGRYTYEVDANGNGISYEYNDSNIYPSKVTTAMGYETSYTYDDNYNMLSKTHPDGTTQSYTYDEKGNITSYTDEDDTTISITYNDLSLPLTVSDGLDRVTTFTYDSLGRRTSITNALGQTTTYEYDAKDRIVKITDAIDNVIEYTYNSQDKITSIKDPNNNITTYTYNDKNQLHKQTQPNGDTKTYTYNTQNQIATITHSNGTTQTYTYDKLDRITSEEINGDKIEYEYNSLNLITQIKNTTTTITYTYDEGGRLLSESIDGNSITTTYDKDNEISSTSYLNNTISYTRNNLGLATQINNINLSYNDTKNLSSITFPNTQTENYTFNKVGELTKLENTDTINYTYNQISQVTQKEINGNSIDYTYDDIGRLTQANTQNYTYDKAGNNLEDNATYNTKTNQLLASDKFTLTYDDNGNLKTKTNKENNQTKFYTFNARNQLLEVISKDENNQTLKTLTFTYDGLNRRYSKTITTNDTNTTYKYLYDGYDIVAILDQDNNPLSTITHGESIDQPLSITTNNQTYYYQRDHQGSITALVDEDNNIVESYSYDAYGRIVSNTKSVETNNPYGYTARVFDDEDLYYYRARYYDPSLQRFLSLDPIGFSSGDFNFYRYVENDPVNFVDPWGEAPHIVYGLYLAGRLIYVGITKQLIKNRLKQHRKTKVFDDYKELKHVKDKTEAKKYEQGTIELNDLLNRGLNKRNSISDKNPLYKLYQEERKKYQSCDI